MSVEDPLKKEHLDTLIAALGETVAQNPSDMRIVTEASYFAGAIGVISLFLNEDEELHAPRRDVLMILLEATTFAQEHM